MTYVVTDACVRCKYMDCVEVCPVDCFYEGENMLVINPNECIDCGVCEPECPAEAILPDTESGLEKWLEVNSKFSAEWPNITVKKDSPADADEWAFWLADEDGMIGWPEFQSKDGHTYARQWLPGDRRIGLSQSARQSNSIDLPDDLLAQLRGMC